MTKLLLVLALLTGFFAALADPDAAADDSHHRLVCCCAVGVDTNEDNEALLTPKQVRNILENGPLFGGSLLQMATDLPEPLWKLSKGTSP